MTLHQMWNVASKILLMQFNFPTFLFKMVYIFFSERDLLNQHYLALIEFEEVFSIWWLFSKFRYLFFSGLLALFETKLELLVVIFNFSQNLDIFSLDCFLNLNILEKLLLFLCSFFWAINVLTLSIFIFSARLNQIVCSFSFRSF